MSTKPAREMIPREPRYPIREGREVNVVIERGAVHSRQTIRGRLLDISPGGVKISVRKCIRFEEEVALKIEVPALELSVDLRARVRWTRPTEGIAWQIGCSVTPKISGEIITLLAANEYIDRRQHPRLPVSLSATVCWQADSTVAPVELRDFSAGGFCMLCIQPASVGRRLILNITGRNKTNLSVPAKVQWQVEAPEGHLIGCAFVNAYDFHSLRATVYSAQREQQVETQLAEERSPWFMVGLIALIAFLLPVALILPINALHSTFGSQQAEHVGQTLTPSKDVAPSRVVGSVRGKETDNDAIAPPKTEPGDVASDVRPKGDGPAPVSSRGQVQLTPHVDTATKSRQQTERINRLNAPPRIERPTPEWTGQVRRGASDVKSAWDEFRATEPSPESGHAVKVPAPPGPERQSPPSSVKDPAPEHRAGTDKPRHVMPEPSAPSEKNVLEAAKSFNQGRRLYRRRKYAKAIQSLEDAVKHDGRNPLYYYYLALSQYQMNRTEDAQRSVRTAAALERTRPIANWGKIMERHQGPPRIWLEQTRSKVRNSGLK